MLELPLEHQNESLEAKSFYFYKAEVSGRRTSDQLFPIKAVYCDKKPRALVKYI